MDDSSLATTDSTANDTQYARLPSLVLANKHKTSLHERLKRECEELIVLTVLDLAFHFTKDFLNDFVLRTR